MSILPSTESTLPLETGKDKTTKTVALALLWTFIASITVLMLVNIFINSILPTSEKADEIRKSWFELLKNGLILLGTALTTIIGYYFGQREGNAKAEQAVQQIEEAKRKSEEAKKMVEQTEKIAESVVQNAIRSRNKALEEISNVTKNAEDKPDPEAFNITIPS